MSKYCISNLHIILDVQHRLLKIT